MQKSSLSVQDGANDEADTKQIYDVKAQQELLEGIYEYVQELEAKIQAVETEREHWKSMAHGQARNTGPQNHKKPAMGLRRTVSSRIPQRGSTTTSLSKSHAFSGASDVTLASQQGHARDDSPLNVRKSPWLETGTIEPEGRVCAICAHDHTTGAWLRYGGQWICQACDERRWRRVTQFTARLT